MPGQLPTLLYVHQLGSGLHRYARHREAFGIGWTATSLAVLICNGFHIQLALAAPPAALASFHLMLRLCYVHNLLQDIIMVQVHTLQYLAM